MGVRDGNGVGDQDGLCEVGARRSWGGDLGGNGGRGEWGSQML